jgi:signal transduction histidine kinase
MSQLLGLDSRRLLGKSLLTPDIIPPDDLVRLSNALTELEQVDTKVALIHRILDRRGLPRWVLHNFWKANLNNTIILRGCIVPMNGDARSSSWERAVISRFVHKIGNHFQLLNLVVSSIRRVVPESRETLMLQETVEKAIELTRNFSDYNQVPTCLSRVELTVILEAATMTRRALFEAKGITFDSQIDAAVSGAIIHGDPYLLELAIGHVLQNALEATEVGGRVTLRASVACSNNGASVANLSVIDSGCGINERNLASVIVPFFTSKKNHDGLGLSMASRFIEIHGGILRISSEEGNGTDVGILLPTEAQGQSPFIKPTHLLQT